MSGSDAHNDGGAAQGAGEAAQPDDAARPDGAIDRPWRRPSKLYLSLSRQMDRIEKRVHRNGGTTARAIGRLVWSLVAAVGVFLLVGPIVNPPLGFDDIVGTAQKGIDSWIARSFHADYDLQRGPDGRLQVEVTEHIDAFFPDDVDESGIDRVIPSLYQRHDLDPTLVSASFDGADVDVRQSHSATRTTFRIDRGERLSGDHDVELRYVLHDMAFGQLNESSGVDEELLEWNAFGPDFPHGVAETSIRVSMPTSLADEFSRRPHGGLSWLLVSDSAQLDPEPDGDRVAFSITNDQNLPPYATVWFRFAFHQGTFTMPPPPVIFWVQVLGPVVPLLLLALVLLLSLATRASLWADAPGRAWYVYQSEPDKSVPAGVASRIMRRMRTAPLVADLTEFQRKRSSQKARRTLVGSAGRAGRVGDIPLAAARYIGASAWRQTFDDGLRRVPRGFVRDMLIAAPLALTVLQWGLVRQVSHQVPIDDFWWPRTVVLVSTALALVVIVNVLSVRPLTRAGALAQEHLLGVRLFLDQTSAAERTSLRDPLLPYIVMFLPARRAGRLVRGLIAREGITVKPRSDPNFLGAGRLTVRTVGVAIIAAVIALVIWVPASNASPDQDAAFDGDTPGVPGFTVTDFSADGVLSTSGHALRLDVHEQMDAVIDSGYASVPQVIRQWHDTIDGHRSALTVRSVTVDGKDVPFEQSRRQGMAMLTTRIGDDWPGEHRVDIRYRVDDPLSLALVDGAWHQQLNWAALNRGWDMRWSPRDQSLPRTVSVSLSMPEALRTKVTGDSGWFDDRRWPATGLRPLPEGSTHEGTVRISERFHTDENGSWPLVDVPHGFFYMSGATLGAQLQFPADTFASSATVVGAATAAVVRSLPVTVPVTLGLVVLVSAGLGLVWMRRRGRLRGIRRDIALWLPTGFTLAQFVTLLWATGEASTHDPILVPVLGAFLLSIAITIVVFVVDHRKKKSA